MKRRNWFAVHGLDAHDRVSRCFCALIGVAGMVAFGAVETTDFVCDGNGNTNLWELSSTEADLYGRKFSENDDAITSPVYGGAVVSVGVSARMFSTGNGSALRMEARPSDIENWRVVHRLVFLNNAVTNETFSLSRADDFRQFRLVFERGVGTMRVGSFKAVWRADGEVAVPHSLAVSEVTESSFIANWVVDEPVDRFLFDCYRESMTSWTGQAKWAEMFVRCVNANKVPKKLTADTFDSYTDLPGWSGDFVYAPSGADGVIQVGKAEKGEGWFVSPELPAMEEVELVVRARAFAEQPDHSMPVFLIRGANTNAVESFELSPSFSDCHCAIPEILAGDRLAFRSFSAGSQCRVLIDAVSIVEGFEPGHAVTNAICQSAEVEYSAGMAFHVEGLEDGCNYAFFVRAVSNGALSEPSEVCQVVTKSAGETKDDEEDEEYSGVGVPVLEAVSLSGIPRKGGVRAWQEDFGSFTNVFTDSGANGAVWLNGVTLAHWQAYYGGTAIDKITRNFGLGTSRGLYAYWSKSKLASTYSLGVMTVNNAKDFVYGLAFKNDTAFAVRSISIGYDGAQFGFNNSEEQVLLCECLVTNELVCVAAQGDWHLCEELTFSTPVKKGLEPAAEVDLPVVTPIFSEVFGVSVPKDGYFILRWRRTAATNAAAMAVDNVAVTFSAQCRPMIIVVR